ncbi:MAG: RNA methyltransferase [Candidatus Bathyarchaeia archaeon]
MVHPIIILVEPENECNVGFIARAMKNFGLKEMRLVAPAVSLGEDAKKCASHAEDVLLNSKIFDSLKDSIEDIDFKVGTTANVAIDKSNLLRIAIPVYEFKKIFPRVKNKIAIIFGRESIGLKNDELKLCDILISIPTDPGYRTMNVSHAASIIFYELYGVYGRFDEELLRRAGKDLKTRLVDYFSQLVCEAGVQEHKAKLINRAFKNVINRAFISEREASLLMGVFRKAVNLTRNNKNSLILHKMIASKSSCFMD